MMFRHFPILINILALPLVLAGQNNGCPAVTIAGPAGQVLAGSEIIFTANVSENSFESLRFRWLTSGGKIISGQGSPSIRVVTTGADTGTKLTAYLTVNGLPDSCPRIAEGEAVVQGGGDAPLIDEFGVLSDRELKQRLRSIVTELRSWPNYRLYIIAYSGPTEPEPSRAKRRKRIQQILRQNGLEAEKITFVNGGLSDRVSNKFYAVPPKPQP